jgi:hypothetical protein
VYLNDLVVKIMFVAVSMSSDEIKKALFSESLFIEEKKHLINFSRYHLPGEFHCCLVRF